ncbi:type III secretion protein [Proteus hauseri]|uniref:type III secretion protein n=1 Tax=Proteus cibi TaxID=2050966 RepID=UPI000D6951E4|nr:MULTISPECIES: type III secretion protein [Proteus]MBG6030215.1 type III secretion protein [Proteus hauseri]MBS6208917.1 type III secretion protein [Proteus hauseri]
MRLPLEQQSLINTVIKRQQKIEKKQRQYQQLLIEAENKKIEQQQLANALKNEIPAYEKTGIYSFVSLSQQRRKQAIVLSSLNICYAQLKEIENKLIQLQEDKMALQKEYLIAVKKQKKMQRYFDRKLLEKILYLERLEQNEIQEMALYEQSNI